MQIASIAAYDGHAVEIPLLLREIFVVVGGEEVTFLLDRDSNSILVFFNPGFRSKKLWRLKVRVKDDLGASFKVYQALEECGVRILSVQGTTIGRQETAVDDFLLDFSKSKLDEMEVLLNVLERGGECRIENFEKYTPPIGATPNYRKAAFEPSGEKVEFVHSVLDDFFKGPDKKRSVIINWDTENHFLTLTFTRPEDIVGKLILFTVTDMGSVSDLLKREGVDLLRVQTNILGQASDIKLLDTDDDTEVRKWNIIADLSKRSDPRAKAIKSALEGHPEIFGGSIEAPGEKGKMERKLFGALERAESSSDPDVRRALDAFNNISNPLPGKRGAS